MSLTGDYLGPLIPIELNTAGLKVGEIMANLRKEGNTYDEVMKKASENPLVSSFSEKIKIDERMKLVSNPELLEELRKLHFELRDFTKRKYNRINPFSEDLFSWEEKGTFWANNNVVIYDSATVSGSVEIGNNTWVGPFCELDGGGKLTIGSYCCISAGVQIMTHDTAKWSLSGGMAEYEYSPVEIGNYCFIGASAIITRGVKIGSHCLIGAGAVVTKDIPSNSIAVGVPAEVIGRVVIENDTIRYSYFDK
jgi:acetyltransferase-like isoleucine patch superfamily enzyme